MGGGKLSHHQLPALRWNHTHEGESWARRGCSCHNLHDDQPCVGCTDTLPAVSVAHKLAATHTIVSHLCLGPLVLRISVCVVCACAGAIFDCFVGVWQFVCSHVVLRTETCAGAFTCFDGVWHAFWSEASVAHLFLGFNRCEMANCYGVGCFFWVTFWRLVGTTFEDLYVCDFKTSRLCLGDIFVKTIKPIGLFVFCDLSCSGPRLAPLGLHWDGEYIIGIVFGFKKLLF